MRSDARLSVALHLLLHISEAPRAITSEALGQIMQQNPAALRRTMAGLREAGIVRAEKGHSGGWSLARPLDEISLSDVYRALGMATAFRIGHQRDAPTCVLERAVNRAVDAALDDAEALFIDRLQRISLAETMADARRGYAARRSRAAASAAT